MKQVGAFRNTREAAFPKSLGIAYFYGKAS
jgi:hypothetical protein